jgi:hypothetical protein
MEYCVQYAQSTTLVGGETPPAVVRWGQPISFTLRQFSSTAIVGGRGDRGAYFNGGDHFLWTNAGIVSKKEYWADDQSLRREDRVLNSVTGQTSILTSLGRRKARKFAEGVAREEGVGSGT